MATAHLILDLDGTVIDTEFPVSEMTAEIAREEGFPVAGLEVFSLFSGLGSREKFVAIAEHLGKDISQEQLIRMSLEHRDRKARLYQEHPITLMPGILDILNHARKSGWRISLASSNETAHSRAVLEQAGIADYFTGGIYGPDSVGGKKKPDPAMFLCALDKSGVPASSTLVIEDTLPGVIAARAAGCDVIAYLDPRLVQDAQSDEKKRDFLQRGARVVRDFCAVVRQWAARTAPMLTL